MVTVSVIGCGYWGVNYARVFSELPDCHLVSVCDKDAERLARLSPRYYSLRMSQDVHEVLADRQTQAVVVSTPASTHYEIVKQCLEAGKHVLVEKPLALAVPEGEDLVALAKQKGLTLMVAHTFLYNPAVRRMKEVVRQPDFGPVYYLLARRTHLGLIRPDVNALWDLVPHDLSIFSYLLEAFPLSLNAAGGRFLHPQKEDVGFITLMYPGGIVGNIQASWVDSNKVREIVVVGGRKRIIFDDLNNLEKIKIFDKGVAISGDVNNFGEFQLLLRDGDIISPKVEATEPLKNQCAHFIECVRDGSTPLTSGEHGLEIVRVMVGIDRSLREGGAPIRLV